MRIAQVAPLYESVPPRLYGGTERIVSYLTEELVAQGHDVTLYASGDSATRARLVPVCERSLRLDPRCVDPLAWHMLALARVLRDAPRFDLIHFHLDYLHFPLSRAAALAQVTTLHGRLDLFDLPALYREFPEMPVVSISEAQRLPLPFANWIGTVPHGLPAELYRPGSGTGGYLAFLGRMSPEKGPERAIEIARRAGLPLRIAAKVDRADRAYFEGVVAPLLRGPGVEFVGEIGEADKQAFLGDALALLCPVNWPEPFGLVMIEALACATPVIALRCGSVPEVIEQGVSGFIAHDVDGAVAAVARLHELDRARCRQAFDARFTAARMARDYVALYQRLLAVPDLAAPGLA